MNGDTIFKVSQAIRFLEESFDSEAAINVDQLSSALTKYFVKGDRSDCNTSKFHF
jgi:hypothetical protein